MYKITQLNESGIEFWNNIIESFRIAMERSKNTNLFLILTLLFACIFLIVISKFLLYSELFALLLILLAVVLISIVALKLEINETKETFKIQKESIERLLEKAESISVIRVQKEFDIMKILTEQSNKNSDEITISIQLVFDESRIAPIIVDDTKLKTKISKPSEDGAYQYEYDINTNTIYYLEDQNTIKENLYK